MISQASDRKIINGLAFFGALALIVATAGLALVPLAVWLVQRRQIKGQLATEPQLEFLRSLSAEAGVAFDPRGITAYEASRRIDELKVAKFEKRSTPKQRKTLPIRSLAILFFLALPLPAQVFDPDPSLPLAKESAELRFIMSFVGIMSPPVGWDCVWYWPTDDFTVPPAAHCYPAWDDNPTHFRKRSSRRTPSSMSSSSETSPSRPTPGRRRTR